MKLGILLFFVFGLAGLAVFLGLSAPKTFYDTAILHGMNNKYLIIEKTGQNLRAARQYEIEAPNGLIVSEENVWKNLHFNSFKVPLPVHHPLFLTFPHIEMSNRPKIGYELFDQKERELVTWLIAPEFEYEISFEDEVFNLPFFKNRIERIDRSKIWQDVFAKEILESSKRSDMYLSNLINDPDKVIFEMLYGIFVLKLRTKLFAGKNLQEISYWPKRNLGIIKVLDNETLAGKPQQFEQEVIYFLNKDQVYPIEFRSKLGEIAAKAYHHKFLEEFSFDESQSEDAIMIYSEYNTLPYHKKIDQEGMIYLYSAWSHDMEKEAFFAEMINFMERGQSNLLHVKSLYEFALKKFGSNFSSDMKKLKETQKQKLQRKISEEKEKELRELQKQDGYVPDTFNSEQHKINFFLDKAKESGVNIDDTGKELIGD